MRERGSMIGDDPLPVPFELELSKRCGKGKGRGSSRARSDANLPSGHGVRKRERERGLDRVSKIDGGVPVRAGHQRAIKRTYRISIRHERFSSQSILRVRDE